LRRAGFVPFTEEDYKVSTYTKIFFYRRHRPELSRTVTKQTKDEPASFHRAKSADEMSAIRLRGITPNPNRGSTENRRCRARIGSNRNPTNNAVQSVNRFGSLTLQYLYDRRFP
jgi:hypothetical protein